MSQKSDIKTWSNTKSEGKLFTVNFLDETGEIRATGFNSEVDSLFETLQEGKVYYISKCRVNMAKKQFSNINNDYELAFSRETEIEECEDDSVPKVNFNFVSLADLANIEKDAIIDVLGVIKEVGELDGIVSKNTGKPYQKRDISIVDSSNSWVRCTIWGASAKTWDHPPDTIVALKGIKVGDYGGKSLSMLNSSSMLANPDIEEAHALRGWYDAEGRRELGTYQSHQGLATMGTNTRGDTKYLNLGEVRDQCLGLNSTEPDYFNTKATIVYIKHENIAYPACSSKDCNKKVIKMDEDSWRCENCNTTHPKPNWRYVSLLPPPSAPRLIPNPTATSSTSPSTTHSGRLGSAASTKYQTSSWESLPTC